MIAISQTQNLKIEDTKVMEHPVMQRFSNKIYYMQKSIYTIGGFLWMH